MGFRLADELVGVDGEPVAGRTFGETVQLVTGTPGERQLVAVRRGGESLEINAEVVTIV